MSKLATATTLAVVFGLVLASTTHSPLLATGVPKIHMRSNPYRLRNNDLSVRQTKIMEIRGGEDESDMECSYASRTFGGHTSLAGRVLSLAFDKDRLWSGSSDMTVRSWDCDSGLCIAALETQPTPSMNDHPGGVNCMALFDGCLWAGTTTGVLHVWNTSTLEILCLLGYITEPHREEDQPIEQHDGSIECMAANGGKVVTGCMDHIVRVWDATSRDFELALEGHTATVFSLAFAGEQKLLSGSLDDSIRIWDTKTWRCEKIVELSEDSRVYSLAVFNNFAFSTSADGSIQVWNMDTWECDRVLLGHQVVLEADDGEQLIHETPVFSLSVDAKRKRLISASSDCTVRVWSLESWECLDVLRGHREWLWSTALDEVTGDIWSGDGGGRIRHWRDKALAPASWLEAGPQEEEEEEEQEDDKDQESVEHPENEMSEE